jgi:hypothetical protein
VVKAWVLRDGAGAFHLGGAGDAAGGGGHAAGGEVVEGDGEEPLAGLGGAGAEDGAWHAGQPGGEQREGGRRTAARQVGADARRGLGARTGGAPVGGPEAGHRPWVACGRVAGGGEPGADRLDEGVPHAPDGLFPFDRGRGDDGGGRGLVVNGAAAAALAQRQGVAGRDAVHAAVGGAGADRLGGVGAGQYGGEVLDVELGLGEVGQRQGGGGVGGAACPAGVEDRADAGEVGGDDGAAAEAGDGGVAAWPGGELAQRARARGDEGAAQLGVVGAAVPEDGQEGVAVGVDEADLVGAPVTHRPQRVGPVPQRHGAQGLDVAGSAGRGAAPPDQPPHHTASPTPDRSSGTRRARRPAVRGLHDPGRRRARER